MYKYFVLGIMMLFASPALAAICYQPVPGPEYDSLSAIYNACVAQNVLDQADATCQANLDSLGGHGTAKRAHNTTARNYPSTCTLTCDKGNYATIGGACLMQKQHVVEPVIETPEPTTTIVSVPVVAPVVETPKKTLLDAVPFFKVKGETSVVSQEKVATTEASVSVEVPAPVRPSLLERVLHALFGWL